MRLSKTLNHSTLVLLSPPQVQQCQWQWHLNVRIMQYPTVGRVYLTHLPVVSFDLRMA